MIALFGLSWLRLVVRLLLPDWLLCGGLCFIVIGLFCLFAYVDILGCCFAFVDVGVACLLAADA